MFLKVYCTSDIVAGDVLHFNSTSLLWERANGIDHPICIARTDAVVRAEGYSVEGVFSGACFAKASRSIPVQGGELQVENGGVYVDNTANGQGIICPQFIDDSTERNAGNLVQVVVR